MIVGIEGVSCVGKTTLAAAVAARLDDPLVVPCYYHSAPVTVRRLPPAAGNAEDQLASLAVLVEIEEMRRGWALDALRQGRDVILDRTVDTLLAHAHAIGRLRGFDCDVPAREIVARHATLVPGLTLLLRAPPETLSERAARRPGLPSAFYDPRFTVHFNAYFRRPVAPRCVVLDATLEPGELAGRAAQQIARADAARIGATIPLEDESGGMA